VLWISAPFSVSSLPTLLQPRGRGRMTHWLSNQITDLVGFKNHQIQQTSSILERSKHSNAN
jgi:hypothetical protein